MELFAFSLLELENQSTLPYQARFGESRPERYAVHGLV
jgi:hypothetical protein